MTIILPSFAFLAGACWASFWITIGTRTAKRTENDSPYSHCQHCRHRLMPVQLLPVIGWLLQKGHCCYCHQPIDPFSTIFEIWTGWLFAANIDKDARQFLIIIWVAASLLTMSSTDHADGWISPVLAIPLIMIPFAIFPNYLLGPWQRLFITALLLIIGPWSRSLGMGDVLFIAILFLFSGLQLSATVVLIAAAGALLEFLLTKRSFNEPLPFVPWLSFGTMIILSLN